MNARHLFTDTNSIPWRKSSAAEGVEVKDLGTVNGRSMRLVRFAAGTKFPVHTHEGPEFVYMLEGEAVQNGQSLRPGWGYAAESGTLDKNFHSSTECIFLTIYSE